MPVLTPQRSLRNMNGAPLWLPIGFRSRGLPGSGGVYDSTNNSLQDQTSYMTPASYAVRSIRLVYSGFDFSSQGEVPRNNTITGNASIYLSTPTLTIATTAASSSGTNTLTFTPNNNSSNYPGVGMGVVGTGVAANTYVTVVTPAYNGSGNITGITVTLSANLTGNVSNGQSITFNGLIHPVKFGGKKQFTLEPMHDFLISDPLQVSIPANTAFFVRTYASFSSTGFVIAALPVSGNLTGEACNRGSSLADHTQTPVTPSNSGGGFWPPAMILGELNTSVPQPSVMVFGDSLGAGSGDSADASGRCGYIYKSLGNTICNVGLARGGTMAVEMANCYRGAYAAAKMASATDIIMALGRNDINLSYSATTVRQNLVAAATPFINAGMRVWLVTVPPTTTSSDGWLTAGNQTIANAGFETQRLAFNSDIKTNFASYGIAGVIDVCASWEDPNNAGKWRTDLGAASADGVHPSAALHSRAVSDGIIPVARFGVG